MNLLYIFLGVLAFLVVFVLVPVMASRSTTRKVAGLQKSGIYPPPGKATDHDVLGLAQAGEKIAAIKCYRSNHDVGLKGAKDAVEEMEKRNPR
ncbi:MAG: hypothetical protein JWM16_5029 [Verrucomicrobiales bacterium]|nr:hypothetical protein [Verrucomicrobiales bacterium]